MNNFDINAILDHIDGNLESSIKRLEQLLEFKSISTDPSYKTDCYNAAKYCVQQLQEIGFDSQLAETPGHPMVLAKYICSHKNAPHVLFYGHYDVQPTDPEELWHSDPFKPQRKIINNEEAIIARGASDDKGQLMTFIEACRAYRAIYNDLPLNVTILLEGEEESGSDSLVPFLQANKEKLQADIALVCDTTMWDKDTACVSIGLRGILAQEIIIKTADRDLHSGSYGGVAANALNILTNILGNLKDKDGRVNLAGFYDDVYETPQDIKDMWQKLNCNENNFLKNVGLSKKSGEIDRGFLESIWARPTADINGIWGGYQGEGFKTVIPNIAKAKISFRLVHNQDPVKIQKALLDFAKQYLPEDATIEILNHGASKAIMLNSQNKYIKQALNCLSQEWQKEAIVTCCGGSIPVVGDFQQILGMQSLLIGFALEDDNIHSPNEKYNIKSFHKGQRSWARVILELAQNKI